MAAKKARTGAQLLTAYMAAEGLSCSGLAAKLGCSKQHVGFLKKGDKTPGLELAVKIMEIAGVPVASWSKTEKKTRA